MSEQALQKKIIDYLKSKGYSVFKTIACNRRGISDIIGCSPSGQFLAIEVKARGKMSTVTPLQNKYLEEIRARGGVAFATDRLEAVKTLLIVE